MIVLDASGSMWGQIDGVNKIVIARDVVRETLGGATVEGAIGLVAYGHNRKGDCSDIEVLVPPSANQMNSVINAVEAINPKGKTPLTEAVRQAADAMRYTENRATVVLVTDGLETCEADPCALARELEQSGLDFTAHVVGFGLSQQDGTAVSCLAGETGGRYFEVDNPGELSQALSLAVVQDITPETVIEAPPQVEPKHNLQINVQLSDDSPPLENGQIDKLTLDLIRTDGTLENIGYWPVMAVKVAEGDYILRAKYAGGQTEQPVQISRFDTTHATVALDAGVVDFRAIAQRSKNGSVVRRRNLLLSAWVMCAVASAPAVQAACTGDLPQGGLMSVYADASSDAVIGGITANQCGLEVTDFCEDGRCLTFFDGLSGYIDVSGLVSGTITPPPAVFEYRVDAVDGSLSFMGREQAFELNGDEPVLITPAADHVLLALPAPLPKDIRMTSTGSSAWEALLTDWVGVPIPVSLYLDRVSAPRATLELFAEHQMLKMDMRLVLARVGGPAAITQVPVSSEPVPGETFACDRTHALALDVGKTGDQDQIDAFYTAVGAAGITNWDTRSEQRCLDLLQQLEQVGIADTPGADTNEDAAGPDASCDALIGQLRPILRGPESAEKSAVLAAMISLGVTSFDQTNPKHCSEIAAVLGQ